jgi:hypothetical protein
MYRVHVTVELAANPDAFVTAQAVSSGCYFLQKKS